MTETLDKSKPIEGKVASIVNSRELSINIGRNDGVEIGMQFKVLAGEPIEIRDPDTDKLLGTLDKEKVRVRVSEVLDTFSVCKTFRTKIVGTTSSASFAYNMIVGRREIPETLKTNDSDYPEPLSEKDSYVKRGDRVLQILEDE
jgi:hypothetical protein